ncbi:MAG TPA: hypothetical protein ENN19_05430 [Chloroflexi bacterium]|nr:hypothetical protein [Chloroflexota bacterium]
MTHSPTTDAQRWRTVAWIIGSLALAGALVIVEVAHLRTHITIGNLDFFAMAARVEPLSNTLSAWVNGFYPVGIPLLLRLGLLMGLDVVRAGQAASIVGGVLCLYSGGLLAWHMTRSRALALLTMAFLLCTGTVLFYAGFEGTDMLAAGLQSFAISLLARAPDRKGNTFMAGLVNGLGYLVRYTGLITLAVSLLYLLTLTICRREKKRLWPFASYGLGFLIGAAPQLIPSLLVKGSLFYSSFPVINQPLAQLAKAGFLFAVLDHAKISREHRWLLAFFVVGTTGALSIFNIDTRFLILIAPALTLSAMYFLWRIVPLVSVSRFRLPIPVIVLIFLLVTMIHIPWEFAHTVEGGPHAGVIESSNVFHAAGAESANDVLTSNHYHQDVASPTRNPYGALYLLDAPPTVPELRQKALASNYRFLYYDAANGVTYHPQYEALLNPYQQHVGYTPIWVPQSASFVAYRLEPDSPTPETATDVQFAGDISLQGYDLNVSADQPDGSGHRIGLYLYWQSGDEITESLKVFVHVFDAQGALVAQDDAVPAQWTRDTRDWTPGESIVDFHMIQLPVSATSDSYEIAVGLYNPATGERRPVHSSRDNQVTLTQIQLEQ